MTEQVAFFRRKLARQIPTERWDDLIGEAHDTAFVVAGAQKADLLSDLAAAVDRAIAEGKSLSAFRKDFDAAVERNGWHGWTGEGSKGGRAWRTRTIYRTNASTSYAAGRRAQLDSGKFALWVYRHGGSSEPRPEHVDWDGLVLPPTHAFWTKHSPPSEWGCSCYVLGARSPAGARRLGGDPDKSLPVGWNTIDPATGAPPGVGRGWDYAPGASVSSVVRAVVAKSAGWQYDIARAFLDSLPDAQWDQFGEAYRRLPSVADDLRRFAAPILAGAGPKSVVRKTIGLVRSAEVARFADEGIEVRRFSWSLSEESVVHVRDRHTSEAIEKSRRQRPVTAEDFGRLAWIVDRPDTITRLDPDDLVMLTKAVGGETFTAIFRSLKNRKTLALVSLYVGV